MCENLYQRETTSINELCQLNRMEVREQYTVLGTSSFEH